MWWAVPRCVRGCGSVDIVRLLLLLLFSVAVACACVAQFVCFRIRVRVRRAHHAQPLTCCSACAVVDLCVRPPARCAKVLDKRVARLCVLASNCDVDAYKKLVKALCETNNIPIIEVETHALLGEWCGLCKLDKEGNARKVGHGVFVSFLLA